ncbi:MAG: hypothetical protein ACYCVH_10595 [Ignavibacteriaceae bacterium]
MNIEKIFDALSNNKMNSALGIICSELKKQDYSVTINNIEVTEEEFSISFINYHNILLRKKELKLN